MSEAGKRLIGAAREMRDDPLHDLCMTHEERMEILARERVFREEDRNRAESALAAERDQLRDRAERAEAEAERLREAWRAFDRIVESNIRYTDGPHRIKDEAGNWHEGPAVDICFKVLRKGQEFARAALEGGDDRGGCT